MLRPIHEGSRMTILYDPSYSYLEIILEHLLEEIEQFKADLQEFLQVAVSYQCKKNLWNLQELQIIIEPELQEWIDTNINRVEVSWGVKKEAFVLPDNFITEMAIEQTMNELHGQLIETRMFINHHKALDWLLE